MVEMANFVLYLFNHNKNFFERRKYLVSGSRGCRKEVGNVTEQR